MINIQNNREILNKLNHAQRSLEKVMQFMKSNSDPIGILRKTRSIESNLKTVENLIIQYHLKFCIPKKIKKLNSKEFINEVLVTFTFIKQHNFHFHSS